MYMHKFIYRCIGIIEMSSISKYVYQGVVYNVLLYFSVWFWYDRGEMVGLGRRV